MDGFSFGQAFGAGFRVIGRNPLAVLAWAAVYLLFLILPALLMVSYALPAIIAATAEMAANPGPPNPAQLGQSQSPQPLSFMQTMEAKAAGLL